MSIYLLDRYCQFLKDLNLYILTNKVIECIFPYTLTNRVLSNFLIFTNLTNENLSSFNLHFLIINEVGHFVMCL